LTYLYDGCIFRTMPRWERLLFWLAYLRGRAPWDTNVTPPELVQTVEGPNGLAPGRALDLGCGTGTNVIYLVRHGWEVVGVDFVDKPIRKARQKADDAGVTAQFFTGDVTRLEKINGLAGSFDLVVDIGCFHSLDSDDWEYYAGGLFERLRPRATYLLYAWGPRSDEKPGRGVSPAQIEAIFGPHLSLERKRQGEERGRPSFWYWFRCISAS
jgi:cyclopropane fatty-acyl-phospholipid synthase-like methyltransferase